MFHPANCEGKEGRSATQDDTKKHGPGFPISSTTLSSCSRVVLKSIILLVSLWAMLSAVVVVVAIMERLNDRSQSWEPARFICERTMSRESQNTCNSQEDESNGPSRMISANRDMIIPAGRYPMKLL